MAYGLCTFVYDAKAWSNFHNEYSNWLLIIRRAFHSVSCLRLRIRPLEIRNGLIAVGNCNIRRLARTGDDVVQQALGRPKPIFHGMVSWYTALGTAGHTQSTHLASLHWLDTGQGGVGRRVRERQSSFMDNSITVCIIQQWLAVIDCLFS